MSDAAGAPKPEGRSFFWLTDTVVLSSYLCACKELDSKFGVH